VNTGNLANALEGIFQNPVVRLERKPSAYSSSYAIEELEIAFQNGQTVTAVFKNMSAEAILEAARKAKPDFLYAPCREIEVYRSILRPLDLGTPKFYGALIEQSLQRYWLFVEKVPAPPLTESGDFGLWIKAAQWLARFHAASRAEWVPAVPAQLLEHDAAYYWRWFRRAHEFAGPALDRLATTYDRVIDVLLGLPRSFIHGEFYASNILTQEQVSGIRVCPLDWEMAAIGPALTDVAALASGKWNRDERLRLLEAYDLALPEHLRSHESVRAFDCCQLALAVQWVGWSQSWRPPHEHKHDWLAEALQISRNL